MNVIEITPCEFRNHPGRHRCDKTHLLHAGHHRIKQPGGGAVRALGQAPKILQHDGRLPTHRTSLRHIVHLRDTQAHIISNLHDPHRPNRARQRIRPIHIRDVHTQVSIQPVTVITGKILPNTIPQRQRSLL